MGLPFLSICPSFLISISVEKRNVIMDSNRLDSQAHRIRGLVASPNSLAGGLSEAWVQEIQAMGKRDILGPHSRSPEQGGGGTLRFSGTHSRVMLFHILSTTPSPNSH